MEFLRLVGIAVVPLVIAVDPAASVIMFLAVTEGEPQPMRRRILRDAFLTSLIVGVGFMFLGAAVFNLLGIDRADFQIGGGLILVVLSLADLVLGDRARRHRDEYVGVVPIGTPMIVGPAVLTALTLLQTSYGTAITLAALLVVLLITAGALVLAELIKGAIGTAGLKAISKIVSILLAGFGVHLIRVGIVAITSAASGG